MESTLNKLVDSSRLCAYVRSSLGDVQKLREVDSFFANNEQVHSILEGELLETFEGCENEAYVQWLCGTLKRLTLAEWAIKKKQLIAAICDPSFSGGPSLVGLALESGILDNDDLIQNVNLLPRNVLLEALRYTSGTDFVLHATLDLKDDALLIVFLVHASHKNLEAVKHFLSCSRRLNRALHKHYDSPDPSLRRFSLALLTTFLEKKGVSNAHIIVNMLTVAEQKQVHLVEPVLYLFVNAVRSGELSEVPWTLSVFRRLFNHQTAWVKTHSISLFLELSEFHRKIFHAQHEEFFCASFLDSIDHLGLYTRDTNARVGSAAAIGRSLRKWLAELQKTIEEERFNAFLRAFIHAVCSKPKWNSVALLYVSEAILGLQVRPVVDDITAISTAWKLWPLQEPLLRKIIGMYWLQIGCGFSAAGPCDTVADLINLFAEECECVRDFVTRIRRNQTTPVDICSAIWSKVQDLDLLRERFECKAESWLSLSRVKDIRTILPDILKILNSSQFQSYAVSMLRDKSCDDEIKKAVFEVMVRCDFDSRMLVRALSDDEPNWFIFCLWVTQCSNLDQSVITKYTNFLSFDEHRAPLLSSEAAPVVFDSIAQLCETNLKMTVDLLDFVCTALPLSPRGVTPSLLRLLLANLQRRSADDPDLERIVLLAWQTSLETRKATSTFAECMDVFVNIFFHPVIAAMGNSDLRRILDLESFVTNMAWFGEKYYLAMIRLLEKHPEFVRGLAGEIARAICYGPTFRKDQKIIFDAESYVLATHNDSALRGLSECQSAVKVRAKSISFAKKLPSAEVELVIDEIRAHDLTVSSTRKRYFNNSNIHRVKTRAWQAILVLLDCDFSSKTLIYESIIEQLINDAHQMTVRIFMEWCAVKILLATETHSSWTHMISTAIEKASEERIGCICSYLSILMHICLVTNDCRQITECIPVILPWTMSQHFAVRLHAQFVFKRVLDLCQCSTNCHARFKPQLDALSKVVNYGCGAKNATKLDRDFYLADCVMTECETYELIFDKIPRAYGLTDVDSIPAQLFEADAKFSKVATRDVKTEFQLEVLRDDSARPDDTTLVQESNFQRKLVPVSALFEEDRQFVSDRDELIVVASLVDRLPNLGGISRTCEIFGVSELVLPNLKMLDMTEFQNLSVSSHQWLPTRGVGANAVEAYLREKKKDGYALIGVEQTAQSVSLEKFRFPKKSLLLLGHEKEGMPLHLIHLMDTCVEIPQQGVVRSLNVHVSAAILIWEYRKQFLRAT